MTETKTPWVDVEEIKRTVGIEQVLARYGVLDKLKRRGNTLTGLSPFRDEKNPSFSVNLEKSIWNDLGGRPMVEGKEVPGNVVGLIMAIERCSFREALLKLHEMAGLAVAPQPASAGGPPAVATATRARVEEALAEEPQTPAVTAAATVMPPAEAGEAGAGEPLVNEPFGKELKGLRYNVPFLEQRGLSPARARYWGVGYCSRGLLKGRIVVPIKNRRGEIVAYIGRSLKEDDPEGKWRFPKGFHKSLELFGADRLARDPETREAVAKYGLIAVEGCFDVISLAEKGFKNTVATLGSEVSPQQCAILIDPELNPTRRVTIFFDQDEAGRVGRKKLAGELIYDAFVRYVDVRRVEAAGRTDPKQFAKEELGRLLGGAEKTSQTM